MTCYSSPEDRRLAETLEARRYNAMKARDAETLEDLLDDELVYTHSFGDRDSKASFLAKLREGFFLYHELKPSIDIIARRGDVLILTGTMWARATVGGEDRIIDNTCTNIWAKTGGNWRFLSFAPTPIRR
ncbi:nuclear transport factor 2 family protein [Paracoccus caeni]|uniref:Nuclear transport factor 2 family protein n=1 Tax=Paracoccus caeni TaxID=657651 RepID=A0A934SDE7_9RHOB|nr:nuclear transport factor 2 family protein [Paracoccus caeni]MBK4216830.1 nuclear transport factor 2 family protein [Paracoccus caeni]